MRGLSRNELEQVAKIRRTKNYEDMKTKRFNNISLKIKRKNS